MSTLAIERGRVTVERIDPRLLTGDPTYLFNIYSVEHKRNTGSTGEWIIPACPEGQEYIRCNRPIPGTVEDIYPHFTDQEHYRARAVPGIDIVKAVLDGGGPNDSIRRFGVFESKNETPTKAELAKAKAILIKELQAEIREADTLAADADPKMRQSAQNEKFFRAARYLNVKKPWLSEAMEMTQCPFCSIAVSPVASICHGCHQIINKAAFEATQKSIGATA